MIYQTLLTSPFLYNLYKKYRTHPFIEWVKVTASRLEPKSLTPPLPSSIVVDSASICNLRCPLCPTGTRTIRLKPGMLSKEDFQFFVSQFPSLRSVGLYNWGEPLLNPHLFEILSLAREKGITTDIDTNFSLPLTDEFLTKLARSGLDVIRVSLDGASQQTYSVYRKYGDFNRAYGNMKRLREIQKKDGLNRPIIYWKFLVHRHNEHEIEKAKRMAKEIDVHLLFDQFLLSEDLPDVRVSPLSLEERKKYWLTSKKEYLASYYKNPKSKPPYLHRPCPWLFSSLVIHTDGTVLPCCYASSETSSMGNIKTESISKIWNSPKYQYARSLFMKGVNVKRVPVVCERCPIFQHKVLTS